MSLPNSPGMRNGVEDPQPLAGARVVGADETLGVGAASRRGAGAMRGADEDDVLGDDRRAVPGDLALDRVELLVGVLLQVDDAVDAEVLERLAGFRVEADELVADGDVEDALVALAVGPVADAAARQSARRPLRARAFLETMHPQQLAGGGVERHRIAMLAGGGIEHAVDHQRRGLQVEVRTRAEVVGAESPGDLQRLEIRGGDLVERRVAGGAQIAGPRPPLAICLPGAGHPTQPVSG